AEAIAMTDEQRAEMPEHKEARTLWTDVDKTQRFLIPDSCQLPPGDFLLRTATGRERRFDPDALTDFEVTDEEAKAWLKEQLGQVTKKLGAGLRDALLGPARQGSARDEPKEAPSSADGGKPESPTPGLDLLADLTDTPRETLSHDYGAIGRALRTYLSDTAGSAGDSVSGDPERMNLARERMDFWGRTLREHGIAAAPPSAPDSGPGILAPQLAPEEATDPGERSHEAPGAEKHGLADRLRGLADEFRRKAAAIAAARSSSTPTRDNPDSKEHPDDESV
ncbi:MAG: hypothetical protein ACREEP_02790, partial [Dongiaceae bacterium]